MDEFDLYFLRPISAISWLIISVLIYRMHRHASSMLLLYSNVIIFTIDAILQLTQHEIIIMEERQFRIGYLTWGILGFINGPLLYWYIVTLIKSKSSNQSLNGSRPRMISAAQSTQAWATP